MRNARTRLALTLAALLLAAAVAGAQPRDRAAGRRGAGPEVPGSPGPAAPPARDAVPEDLGRISAASRAAYLRMARRVAAESLDDAEDFRLRILPEYDAMLSRMTRFAREASERAAVDEAREKERDRRRAIAEAHRDTFFGRLAAIERDYDARIARQGSLFPEAYEVFLRDFARAATDAVRLELPLARGSVEVAWRAVLREIDAIHDRHARGK